MGNEESTLGDENEDDVEITLKVKPKQSKVASDAPGEIPVFVFPPGEKVSQLYFLHHDISLAC